MSEPFLGEIRAFSFNFVPKGWYACDGQLLPINQFQALFSLLGTTYGGNGQTTFALPDLRGRAAVKCQNSPTDLGERGGVESVALTVAQMPSHGHMQVSTAQATQSTPAQDVFNSRGRRGANLYAPPGQPVVLKGSAAAGQGLAHDNMQPFLVLTFAIAAVGIFPSRN